MASNGLSETHHLLSKKHKSIPELFVLPDQVNGFYLSLARK